MPNPDFKQGTSLLGKVLAAGRVTTTSTTTLYTVPANSAVKVASLSLSNASNIPVQVTVMVVPSGQTASDTYAQLYRYYLGALDTVSHQDVLSFISGAMLDAGASIAVSAASPAGASIALGFLLTGSVSA